VEDYFVPVMAGQVAGIVGQTSHYKSGLMHFLEHKAAQQLVEQNRENECIIHVSVEESVEEQAFLEFARYGHEEAGQLAKGEVQDWESLIKLSYTVAGVPIFRVGDSLERSDKMQVMHLTNIMKTIDFIIKEFKVKPALIGIDYLQALPMDVDIKKVEDDSQRRLQVRSDAYRIRKMAVKYTCPLWVAAQAKQQLANVDKNGSNPILIPGMYDIQESADVAQRFDRLLGLWLPARTYPIGTKIKIGNYQLEVTEDLLFVKVNKQRGGLPAGRVFICQINFANNTIEPRTGPQMELS
jgi:hypothetical protein